MLKPREKGRTSLQTIEVHFLNIILTDGVTFEGDHNRQLCAKRNGHGQYKTPVTGCNTISKRNQQVKSPMTASERLTSESAYNGQGQVSENYRGIESMLQT